MAAPVFTPLPTAPNRQDSPDTFNTDADAFVAALSTFQSEGNTLGSFCEEQAQAAETAAATISSTVTTYTDASTFNSATPSSGDLYVLLQS